MAPWPVVHWQVTSVTPQPEPGMAATRQATFCLYQYEEKLQWELGRHTAQSGTAERSGVWAETTASEVANAAMVEKRMVSLFDYKRYVILSNESVRCVRRKKKIIQMRDIDGFSTISVQGRGHSTRFVPA